MYEWLDDSSPLFHDIEAMPGAIDEKTLTLKTAEAKYYKH